MDVANNGFCLIREVINGSGSVLSSFARRHGKRPDNGGGIHYWRTEIIGADPNASKKPRSGERRIRVIHGVNESEDSVRSEKTGLVLVRKRGF